MSFHVYQNWHRKRALVHRSHCSHCNNGQGKQPQDSGRNGKWHGPFSGKAAAAAFMQTFGYAETDLCRVCNP